MAYFDDKKALIFLNKSQSSISETFIENHINHFRSGCININPYLPLEFDTKRLSPLRSQYERYKLRKRRRALEQRVNVIHPDIVLAEFGPVGAECFQFLKHINIQLVVHFHGQDAHAGAFLRKYGERYKEMFVAAKAIVVVSTAMKEALLQLGAPESKLKVNVYGVDEAKFQQVTPSANSPTIITVGRFVDKKAPYLTLLAFKKVNDQFPDSMLKMVGDGYLLETCKRLAMALNLQEKVQFTGSLSHTEVIQSMRSARIFAMHSVVAHDGDSEGTPNVVLEAGCMGLPVVCTRHAGIADVVEPGKTGYLVEEGDVDHMAACMIRLLESPALCDQIGNQARRHILENFRLEDSMKKLEEILFS